MRCASRSRRGSGKILSAFFGISPALGSLLFFAPAALVLYLGLGAIGKGEKFISIGMVCMIALLVVATLINENADVARLMEGDWVYMVPVFNIAVFCFSAQYIVPEMARGFVNALYFAGAFSGVILSIMPILMLRSARRNGDLQPAWQCGWIAHPLVQGVSVLIYLGSAAYAICSALDLLLSGW